MKKGLKGLLFLVIGVVIVLDVVLTIYLLNYNKYNVSVFGKKSLLIMTKKLENFEKDDLLIVEKAEDSEYKVGDHVFFYDTSSKESIVNYGKINKIDENEGLDNTFVMNDNFLLSYENIIGKSETVKVYSGLGGLLGLLASRWVFLIVIILPITVLFMYQLYLLILEVKKSKK